MVISRQPGRTSIAPARRILTTRWPAFSPGAARASVCSSPGSGPVRGVLRTSRVEAMERLGFLCVLAGALRVAIPLNLVLSVEEAGPLTPVPFSPELVEGLVMAVGRVLPQMSLTAALGEAGRDGGVLVVVAASDDVRALRVDQVAGMVQVDVQAIESAGAAGHAGLGEAQAGRPLL